MRQSLGPATQWHGFNGEPFAADLSDGRCTHCIVTGRQQTLQVQPMCPSVVTATGRAPSARQSGMSATLSEQCSGGGWRPCALLTQPTEQ
jgi:hypothetical protein